ncbi:MAG: DUF1501 domain-containing protein, partial [Planctomycetaceae bacterium]|nr:DUF1501 domain-containing protein [Planctomycetaceae bacterium]
MFSRRQVLQIGGLGVAGLALDQLLRLEAAAGVAGSRKAIVMLHLDGGPSQFESIDPKPLAPIEIRGPFSPIATSLPGLQI